MSAQTAAVLDLGRHYVTLEWGQGAGERCSLVAIATADRVLAKKHGQTHFMDASYALGVQVGTQVISDWNDTPGRRVSEVLDAFTAAAAAERATT